MKNKSKQIVCHNHSGAKDEACKNCKIVVVKRELSIPK